MLEEQYCLSRLQRLQRESGFYRQTVGDVVVPGETGGRGWGGVAGGTRVKNNNVVKANRRLLQLLFFPAVPQEFTWEREENAVNVLQ